MVDFDLAQNHLCRDFLTQPAAVVPGTTMYVMSIFMRHVLGFGLVGQTNFDLLGTYQVVSSLSASLNSLGLGFEYDVALPTASYLVSASDVDRILALRSLEYPRHNSGLFRITAVNTGTNSVTIDYRSDEFPPFDPDVPFAIFEAENTVRSTWMSGSNGGVGYNSFGGASASRIILKSNEVLATYQVRLALESSVDINGAVVTPLSIAPGFLGNNIGDFEGKAHLHGAHWHDTTSSFYRGLTIGTGHSVSAVPVNDQWRINLIGNAEKCTVGFMIRSGSTIASHWGCFGVPEDEPDNDVLSRYIEEEHIFRLFSLGSADQSPDARWRFDYQDRGQMNGVAWGTSTEEPISCIASTYFPAAYNTVFNQDFEMQDQPAAAGVTTSSWHGGVDLLDVELLAGTFDTPANHDNGPAWEFQPRRVGRLPFFRQGYANIGNWVGCVGGHFPSSSWIHSLRGIYMEWGGPFPSDMTQGPDVILLEATAASSSTGLLLLDPVDPGEDPITEEIEFAKDIDAVRYRKTYSFYRQEPRLVDFVKGGSNPSGGNR